MVEIKFKSLKLIEFGTLDWDIEGFLLLSFNGKTFGYMGVDKNFHPGTGEIFKEWLITWFDLLNIVVRKLVFDKQLYVALMYIENAATWIEFVVHEKDLLIVSLIEVELPYGSIGTLVGKPFDKYTYGAWKNVEISLDEFAHEVIDKTKKLIQCVKEINPTLLQAKSIQELMQYVEDFEKLASPH